MRCGVCELPPHPHVHDRVARLDEQPATNRKGGGSSPSAVARSSGFESSWTRFMSL